jgi:hypothetical protein
VDEKHPVVLGGIYRFSEDGFVYTGVMRTMREGNDGFRVGTVDMQGRRSVDLYSNGNNWKGWSYLGETHEDAIDGLTHQILALHEQVEMLDRAVAQLAKLASKSA